MLFDHILIFFIILGVCIGLAALIVFIKFPRIGYLCLFGSIALGQLARLSLGTNSRGGSAIIATDLIVLLIGFSWIVKKIIYERTIGKTRYALPIVIFSVIALLSFLIGIPEILHIPNVDLRSLIVSFSYWFRFVAYALLYFITAEFLNANPKHKSFLLHLILWTSILVSIGGFIQLLIMPDFTLYAIKYGWDPHQNRLLGTFFDPNFIGSYFAMILALAFSLFPSSNKKLKAVIVVAIIFCSIALLLTFSRTGYVAFLSAFLIIGALRSPKLIIIGLLCITLGLMSSPRAVKRITDGLSVDATGLKRVESWNKGMRILANYPLLGVGYNNLPQIQDFYSLVDQFDVNNRSGLENTLLSILVTTGITGALAYIWLWYLIISDNFKIWLNKKLYTSDRNLALGIATGLIALVMSSIFMNSLLYPFLLVHIWILASLTPHSNGQATN